jgi:hypothetical protein
MERTVHLGDRDLLRAIPLVLAIGVGLTYGSASLASNASNSDRTTRADAFRAELGLPSAQLALTLANVSPSSVDKWGIPLTATEEADLDQRAVLQEQLGDAQAMVASNGDRLGGTWLDQRAGNGKGFVMVVAFKKDIDEALLEKIRSVVPQGVKVAATVVRRSMNELEAIAESINKATTGDQNVSSISIAPQENAVLVRTIDGKSPAGVAFEGVVVLEGSLEPTASCVNGPRCTTRPYRGGMGYYSKWHDNGVEKGEQCTSGFFARKTTNNNVVMITAAHCQKDYTNDTVYAMDSNDFILGDFGIDIVPSHSIFCLTECDMDTEVLIFNSLTSVPNSKNIIYYTDNDKSHPITLMRNWGSSWVGAVVCSAGNVSQLQCGTIVSVGQGRIDMHKESFIAKVNKGAFATYTVAGGDSGGPVVNQNTAYGLNSALDTVTGNAFFTSISPAMSPLNLTLCIAAGC